MPKVELLDRAGKVVGDRDLPSELFEASVNVPLMHQVVVAGLAALRAGTHSTKTRAGVRGGGRKPWRQKGTGRARQGSIRAPQWAGGGVAHGPKPRDYDMRVNKKMKRAALRGALTDAQQSNKLALIDDFGFSEPRTKDAVELVHSLELTGKILVVLDRPTENVEKSFRNLPYIKVSYARSLNVYELLAADRVLFTAAALDVLEGKEPATPAISTDEAEESEAEDSTTEEAEGGDET
ncbi:MAG TPA: 50S ribosomal protein L4 [Actinomycetota bacterium]|nr:50S ribosomal protein L4 [Actinomycetota bacterium]